MEKGLNEINKCCLYLSRFDDLMRSKFPTDFFFRAVRGEEKLQVMIILFSAMRETFLNFGQHTLGERKYCQLIDLNLIFQVYAYTKLIADIR